jgi:hypothetical protein
MNAIDPSDNYGGGKVKFFTGGSGGGGETIILVPIMFGSNEVLTDVSEGFIPLNVSSWINQGSIVNQPYAGDTRASSYLPTLDATKSYYYYASKCNPVALTYYYSYHRHYDYVHWNQYYLVLLFYVPYD